MIVYCLLEIEYVKCNSVANILGVYDTQSKATIAMKKALSTVNSRFAERGITSNITTSNAYGTDFVSIWCPDDDSYELHFSIEEKILE